MKFLKSFARWQHLAARRGLYRIRLSDTCIYCRFVSATRLTTRTLKCRSRVGRVLPTSRTSRPRRWSVPALTFPVDLATTYCWRRRFIRTRQVSPAAQRCAYLGCPTWGRERPTMWENVAVPRQSKSELSSTDLEPLRTTVLVHR